MQLVKQDNSKADYEDGAEVIYRLREQKQKVQVANANRDELSKRMANMRALLRKPPAAAIAVFAPCQPASFFARSPFSV